MDFPAFASHASTIEDCEEEKDILNATTDLLRAIPATPGEPTVDELEQIATVSRFIQGQVFPDWEQKNLSATPQTVYSVIARAAGNNTTTDDIREKLSFVGEIGDVAATYTFGDQQSLSAFSSSEDAPLTTQEVYTELHRMSNMKGQSATKQRNDILFGLLNRCSSQESKYLVRLVLSADTQSTNLGVGVTEDIVEEAIADITDVEREDISLGMQLTNDYEEVYDAATLGGEGAIRALDIEIGRPIQPMFPESGTIRGAIEKWGQVAVEVKFDGARAQVHYDGKDNVTIFSRNMKDVTSGVPEVVKYIKKNVDDPVILDGEILALDDDGQPQSFQEVLQRYRQTDNLQAMMKKIPVQFFAFDCLYHDSETLLEEPLRDRYRELQGIYPSERTARQRLYSSVDGIGAFESKTLAAGHEGVMVKDPTSSYIPGRRGKEWQRIKPDDRTVDVTVTGGEWENKEARDVLKSFLVGARTERGFKTIGKIGEEISRTERKALTESLRPYIRSETGQAIDLQPAVVLEVGYDEVRESPRYTSQYALQLPRFIGIRTDKNVDEVVTLEAVKELVSADKNGESKTRRELREDRQDSESMQADSKKTIVVGEGDLNIVDLSEEVDEENEEADDDDDDDESSNERIFVG